MIFIGAVLASFPERTPGGFRPLSPPLSGDKGREARGADLREGKLTLPIIHALQNAGDGNRARVLRIVRNKDFSPAEFETLVDLLNHCGSLDYTRRMAAEHIRQAKQALAVFEPCPAKELLLDIADYALARKI